MPYPVVELIGDVERTLRADREGMELVWSLDLYYRGLLRKAET